jgi:polyisoprenoid-binding protein YceI
LIEAQTPTAEEMTMPKWIFEPGHTGAEFRARHMMVSWVRGHFKDVHGSLMFDPDKPGQLSLEATIEVSKLWTGEPQRDNHLRSGDFLDAEKHSTITFKSASSTCVGTNDYKVSGKLAIRGISRDVVVDMHYLGKWQTPYWTDKGDTGPVTRLGFTGEARIIRQDFQVSWNGQLQGDGVVVSDEIFIKVDVEALLETELNRAMQKGSAR